MRTVNNASPIDSAGGSMIDSSEASSMGSPHHEVEEDINKIDIGTSTNSMTTVTTYRGSSNFDNRQEGKSLKGWRGALPQFIL